MKKIIITITTVLALASLASCSMFQLDNYDGPNAQIHGKVLDTITGEPIGVEAAFSQEIDWANVDWATWTFPVITVSKGSLVVNELGWKNKEGVEVYEDQRWFIRFDGQYRNNLIFAGDYKALYKELPCYETDEVFTVKKGDNKVDLKATPFCRIVDPHVTYDATTKKVKATFKVELGDETKANTIMNLRFCGNTQLFVGATVFNLVSSDDAGAKKEGFSWGTMVFPAATPGQEVTLEIDTQDPKNADLFKYNQTRYFRIAAQAAGNGYNSQNAYNFSPIFKVSADFSDINVYNWGEI